VPATAVSDGVTPTGSTAFVLFQDGSVGEFKPQGVGGFMIPVFNAGTPSGAVQISGSQVLPGTVFVLYGDGSVWRHSGTNPNSSWSEVCASGATQISAGVNAAGKATVFVLFSDGSVWEHSGTNPNTGWAEVWGGGVTQISASQAQADTVFLSFGGDLWEHTGKDPNTGWTLDAAQFVASFSAGVDGAGNATVFALFQQGMVREFFSGGGRSGALVDFAEGATGVFASPDAANAAFVDYGGSLWEHFGRDPNSGWVFVTGGVAP
jgi:hypothetical protein